MPTRRLLLDVVDVDADVDLRYRRGCYTYRRLLRGTCFDITGSSRQSPCAPHPPSRLSINKL
eukprot:2268423-Pyramimonas_sp.AAC.1